ncbi:unnamed protein product, partial [Allacma fusca]
HEVKSGRNSNPATSLQLQEEKPRSSITFVESSREKEMH